MLEAALEAGFAGGRRRRDAGRPDADPGVAYLTRALRLDARRRDQRLAQSVSRTTASSSSRRTATSCPTPSNSRSRRDRPADGAASSSGQARHARRGSTTRPGRYIEFCKSTFPNELDLRGLKIVVDCAHGAAYNIAPARVPRTGRRSDRDRRDAGRLQHQRRLRRDRPEGARRTRCGHKADLGIALDGDADRLHDVRRRRDASTTATSCST